MALWGRLGKNSDDDSRGNIPLEKFNAVVTTWIWGAAAGGLTNAEALAELGLDADEQTQANRYRTALNALPNETQKLLAQNFVYAVMNCHELGSTKYNGGPAVEQALVDWFAAKGITF